MPQRPSSFRSDLRLLDLTPKAARGRVLLSIRLPDVLVRRLDRLCRALRARKGEVVTATLNEGLQRYDEIMGDRRRPPRSQASSALRRDPPGRPAGRQARQ
jgi:hypothetical protein